MKLNKQKKIILISKRLQQTYSLNDKQKDKTQDYNEPRPGGISLLFPTVRKLIQRGLQILASAEGRHSSTKGRKSKGPDVEMNGKFRE